jgi:dihydrofolate reductase
MSIHRNFIIGGASIYSDALTRTPNDMAYVDRVLLTRVIDPEFNDCDTFIPDITGEEGWRRTEHNVLSSWVGFEVPDGIQEENGVKYEFQMWVR